MSTRQAHHKMVNEAADAFDANPTLHNATLLIAAVDVLGHTTNHLVRAMEADRRANPPNALYATTSGLGVADINNRRAIAGEPNG